VITADRPIWQVSDFRADRYRPFQKEIPDFHSDNYDDTKNFESATEKMIPYFIVKTCESQ
jgi:hypothetical protein